jgi:hypothetical protein
MNPYIIMAGTILQALYSCTYDLEDSCIPYGTRLALGKYYTYIKSENDLIDISFNTNVTIINNKH